MTIPDAGYMGNDAMLDIPITPEEEKRIVTELNNEAELNLKEGNLYYVVSNRWFTSWDKYTKNDAEDDSFNNHYSGFQSLALSKTVERPGPIDNSDIVSKGVNTDSDYPEISRGLLDGSDYVLVPQRVWERLFQWYGGGPPIPRKMISEGEAIKQFNVEVYPLCLNLLDSRDNSQSIIRLSKKASIQELYEKVCKLRQAEPEKARIWDYFNQKKHEILEDSSKTLEKSELQMDQHILLDVEVDGFWPPGYSMDSTGNELALIPIEPPTSSVSIAGGPSLSNGHSSSYSYSSSFSQGSFFGSGSKDMEDGYSKNLNGIKKSEGKGLAGLQNLGNTCFMNSALQCLVHTPPIAEYFLQDYSDEINRQNPLGLHGELALAFGELLRKLWSAGRTAIPPRAFKGKLARFAPQFSGYNQHDSQELLAFLLDGLHEDLNRVKQKPYFEAMDSDGRPDEEVADECWRNHKARNDSIIVDVCQGQYKSTLVCPVCEKISITFDPFMYLSLPLPSTATRLMTITVIYTDGSCLPIPFTVTVLKTGLVRDLSQELATACCLSIEESLLLAEVYQKNIYRYFDSPLEPLSIIKDGDYIVAYKVPKNRAGLTRLEIIQRYQENVETNFVRKRFSEPTEATRFRCLNDSLKACEWKFFLAPLVIYVEKQFHRAKIELAIRKTMLPLKRESLLHSTQIINGKEINGSETRLESDNNSSSNLSGAEIEFKDVEREDIQLALQLCIMDDRGNCRPILKDTKIEPRPLVKVTLDWSTNEFDNYDPSYLKDLPQVHKIGISSKKTKQEAISLFSCLDAFLKEEPLGPDDMWFCPGCKEHRQATKKLDLWRLPEILVFHLKRFSYSRYLKNKLETFVNFDIHYLDLDKYVKCKDASGESHVYELYAISNHYGGLGGGHYSAYAKLIEENRWYHFDDSHVSSVNESEIKTSAAYVLFYQRVKIVAALDEPSQSQVGS